MNKKVIAGVVAVILLAGGAFAYSQGEQLQGKFSPTKFSSPTISSSPIKGGPFGSAFSGGSSSATSIDGLSFRLDSSSPSSDILVLGSDDNELAVFKLTSDSDEYEVTDMVLSIDSSVENNINAMYVGYENADGDDVLDKAYPSSGEISFTGLELYVGGGDDAKVTVYADLNSGAEGADSGDVFSIELDEVETVNLDSGDSETATSIAEVANEMTVYESKPVFELSSASPSGSQSVSASDTVMVFSVEALEGEDVVINDFTVDLASNGALNSGASVTAYLKQDGVSVSTDSFTVSSASAASMNFTTMAAYGDIVVEEGNTSEFSIELSTVDLMSTSASDDYLTLSIDLGSASGSGDLDWSDDGATPSIKWVGDLSSSTLRSNTLAY